MPKDPTLEMARNQIQQQLDARRKQIGDLRPLGKRLDGARAALERARARQTTAEDGLKLAQQTVASAREEVAKIAQEVAELEKQVSQPPPPSQDTLDGLTAQLQAAVQDLTKLGCVSPEAIAEAQSQSETIISKFRATLASAVQTSHHRLNGKQQPAPLNVRHRGKQPPKRFIHDYFTPQNKHAKVFQEENDDISDM